MRLFSPPLLALFVVAVPMMALAQSSGSGNEAPVRLQRIIIPRLEFREATLEEALQFLTRKRAELDTTTPDGTKRRLEFVARDLPDTRITLSLQNVSLDEALRYVAALGRVRLTFTTTGFRVDAVPRIASKLGTRIDSVRFSTAQRGLIAKARGIIVPRLEFREVTIREGIDFLRKKGVENDRAEPNPNARGVNLVLIGGSNYFAIPRLTLSKNDTSLFDLSFAITEIAGGELRVTDSAFVLDFTEVKVTPANPAP